MPEFLVTVLIVTLAVLFLALGVVLYNIPTPKAIEVTKKRSPHSKQKVALSGDADGDGILSEEEIRVQLEGVAAQLKMPLTVIQGYWRSFNRYDVDDSGSVDAKELNNMLIDSIGHKLSDEEIKNILLDVDADGSGAIEFGEFCVLASKIDMGEQTPEELYEAFMLWSEGKDKIPGEVMRRALVTLGDKMTPEEADEFMRSADVDNDGTIDYREFTRAMAWQHQEFDAEPPHSP